MADKKQRRRPLLRPLMPEEFDEFRKAFLVQLPTVAGLLAVSDPELEFDECAAGAVDIVRELLAELEAL